MLSDMRPMRVSGLRRVNIIAHCEKWFYSSKSQPLVAEAAASVPPTDLPDKAGFANRTS
jgi:hypothetical protein